MRAHFLFAAAIACSFAGVAHAQETPADLEAKGVAALKLSQTQPDAIVSAAIYFGKAVDAFEKLGDEAKTTDMNSYLYWCKKKMTAQQMEIFLKGGDAAVESVAKRMKVLEKTAPKADDAKLYFDRAEAYAQAHPGEHLLIAIRFYEIADRFKGTDRSLQAQDRSLQEMMKAGQADSAAAPTDTNPAVPAKTQSVPPAPAVASKKLVVPGAAQQKEAEKTVREIFKEEFAKNTPADKTALAQKLCAQADESKDDPAARYQLLVMAANLSAEAADFDAMAADFDKLSADFDGDLSNLQKFALGLAAARTKDAALSKLAAAFKTLIDKPDDGAANLIAGKHYFFTKGDFERAMPLLAKSVHPTLSKLARDDLARPQEPPAQIASGDAWWDAGEKSTDKDEKKRFEERAAQWYQKALPSLNGLVKMKIEKRMEAAGITMAAVAATPSKAAPAAPIKDFNPIGLWRKEDGAGLTLSEDHKLNFLDSGGSWRMDGGKLILDFDKWGRREIEITDTEKFQEGTHTYVRVAKIQNYDKGEMVNVLKYVVPTRDAITRGWSMVAGVLCCDGTTADSRLQLPFVPDNGYNLRVTLARTAGTGDIGIVLVNRFGGQVMLFISAWDSSRAGLSIINGVWADKNPTGTPFRFENNKSYEMLAEVRNAAIRVSIDGRILFEHAVEPGSFSLNGTWKLRRTDMLGLWCNRGQVEFKAIEVNGDNDPLAPQPPARRGALPPGADAPVAQPGEKPAAPANKPRPANAPLSSDEARLQADFRKAFNTPGPAARKEALNLLANTYHISTWQLLANAANNDPDESVRVQAMSVLAHEPARNGTLAHVLAQCFTALKLTDLFLKGSFAKEMAASEFKYEIASTLENALLNLRYPDVYRSAQALGRKEQQNFQMVLDAFNALAKSDVLEGDSIVHTKIKQWWEANQQTLMKADKELTEKYKKEDEALK